MADPVLEDVEFPLAQCGACEREVITYVEMDGDDQSRHCLHCGSALAEWHSASVQELEAAGYSLLEARACGNGGGCSTGCGMRR